MIPRSSGNCNCPYTPPMRQATSTSRPRYDSQLASTSSASPATILGGNFTQTSSKADAPAIKTTSTCPPCPSKSAANDNLSQTMAKIKNKNNDDDYNSNSNSNSSSGSRAAQSMAKSSSLA